VQIASPPLFPADSGGAVYPGVFCHSGPFFLSCRFFCLAFLRNACSGLDQGRVSVTLLRPRHRKGARSAHLLYWIPACQSVQKPSPPLFSAHSGGAVIPGFFCHSGPFFLSFRFFFLSFRRKACPWLEQGPESLFLLRPRHRKGARSARFPCWIPACARMTK